MYARYAGYLQVIPPQLELLLIAWQDYRISKYVIY